jgi:hypothetical protein
MQLSVLFVWLIVVAAIIQRLSSGQNSLSGYRVSALWGFRF